MVVRYYLRLYRLLSATWAPATRGTHRARCGLLGCLLIWGCCLLRETAVAQPNPDSLPVGPLTNLKQPDRQLLVRWKALREELSAETPRIVDLPRQFQTFLDLPEDYFLTDTNADGATTVQGFKRHVEETLRTAPAAVRQAYEVQYGAEADQAFAEAKAQLDTLAMQQVLRRFRATRSGDAAAVWLVQRWMDRGEFWQAAQLLERLQQQQLPGAPVAPALRVRAAVCWARLGDTARAETLLQELSAAGTNFTALRWGSDPLPDLNSAVERTRWLKSIGGRTAPLLDPGWVVRGDGRRSGKSAAQLPFGRPLWQVSLQKWNAPDSQNPLQEEAIDLWAQFEAFQPSDDLQRPSLLPASQPLVVGQTVLVRFADHLAAFDVATGREQWRSVESDRTFQQLRTLIRRELTKPQRSPEVQRFGRDVIEDLRMAFTLLVRDRLWFDRNYGSLSSNGTLVFSVEDSPLDVFRTAMAFRAVNTPFPQRNYNRLVAHDVATGKMRWEVGGPEGTTGLSANGHFFLGAPLPFGRSLAVLAEFQGEVRLLALSAATGEVEWFVVVSRADIPILSDQRRRYAGLSPAFEGGLLLCPTDVGALVAVDPLQRSLVWAGVYRQAEQQVPDQGGRFFPGQGGIAPLTYASTEQWQDRLPIVVDDTVLLTPGDVSELLAFKLSTGELRWRIPRSDLLYVLGADRGVVVAVAQRELRGYRLEDGTLAWKQAIEPFDGRGTLADGLAYLPQRTQEIAIYQVENGHPRPVLTTSDTPSLGNLLSHDKVFLSQSAGTLVAFWPIEKLGREVDEQLRNKPDNAELLALRGEYRLATGNIVGGVRDLRAAYAREPAARTQSILFKTLLTQVHNPPAELEFQWEELLRVAQSKEQRVLVQHAWAIELQRQQDWPAYWRKLLEMTAPDLGPPMMIALDSQRSIRLDRWVGSETADLWNRADAPLKAEMERELQTRLQQATEVTSPEALRRYLRFFFATPFAQSAQQQLITKILADQHTIETDLLLGALADASDPEIAAGALKQQVLALQKLGLATHVSPVLNRLERDYSTVATGSNETASRFAAAVREALPPPAVVWPTGRIEATQTEANTQIFKQETPVSRVHPAGEFLDELQFVYDAQQAQMVASDQNLQPRWRITLPKGDGQAFQLQRLQAQQHLLTLTIGRFVRAYDVLTADLNGGRPRLLWEIPIADNENAAMQVIEHRTAHPLGRTSNILIDLRTRRVLGNVNGFQGTTAVHMTRDQVQLIDALSGQILWKWRTSEPVSEVVSVGEKLLVIHEEPLGRGLAIRGQVPVTVLERQAGREVGKTTVPLMSARLIWQGGAVLVEERTPNQVQLKLLDVLGERVVWANTFEPQTLFHPLLNGDWLALRNQQEVERIRATDGTSLWKIKLPHDNLFSFAALPSAQGLTILCNERVALPPGAFSTYLQLQSWSAYSPLITRGRMYHLEPDTGEIVWQRAVDQEHIDPLTPIGMPIWLFLHRIPAPPGAAMKDGQIKLTAVDRLTGQQVWQEKVSTSANNLQIAAQPAERTVRITFNAQEPTQLTLKFTGEPLPQAPAELPPVDQPGDPAPAPPPQ